MNQSKIKVSTGFRQLPRAKWPTDAVWLLDKVTNPYARGSTRWKKVDQGTRDTHARNFAVFLDWLVRTDRYDPSRPLVDQVTREVAEAFDTAQAAAELGWYTRAVRLKAMGVCLRELAPDRDWHWLQIVAQECERLAKAYRQQPTEQPLTDDLVRVGCTLIRESTRPSISPFLRALLYRDGLLILFFALVGPRRGAVGAMSLNVHLKTEGDRWLAHWPAENVKGKRKPLTRELPDVLVPLFKTYLEVHRSVLLRQAKKPDLDAFEAVWVSTRGTRMCDSALYTQHRRHTKAILGIAVNPHFARHAGATYLAVWHPDQLPLVQHWLGHTNPDTGRDYYMLGKALEAGARFVAAQQGLRDTARGKLRGGRESGQR